MMTWNDRRAAFAYAKVLVARDMLEDAYTVIGRKSRNEVLEPLPEMDDLREMFSKLEGDMFNIVSKFNSKLNNLTEKEKKEYDDNGKRKED